MTGDHTVQVVPQSERGLALAAAIATVVLWASAFVGIRAAGRVLSPGSLALARLVVGAVALGILVAVRRQPLPRRADIPGLVTCGVLWFGAYNLLLNQAERTVDAGTAAMLVNTGPVFESRSSVDCFYGRAFLDGSCSGASWGSPERS